MTKAQKELLRQPTIQQAYPEYYLIQITKFKDIINEPLDEWIYFFKWHMDKTNVFKPLK